MRIGLTIVAFILAWTFSVLIRPMLAATYVINAALPAGGDCEHPLIGGTRHEDRDTCVFPPNPHPGLLIDAIWLLVRTAGGTYETARPSQVGSRNNGIAASCFLP
jgi:hypothetical protein